MIFRNLVFIITCIILSTSACKRGSGEGGSSTIRGKVYRYKYNANWTAMTDSGYIASEDVYIIYGDDATFGDDQKTNFDGTYEFNYLRKGTYTIYAYSNDSTKYPYTGNTPEFLKVEITDNKQVVEVPDLILVK